MLNSAAAIQCSSPIDQYSSFWVQQCPVDLYHCVAIIFNMINELSIVIPFRMPAGMVICLCVAFFFWTVRLLRVIKHLCKAWQIREFYYTALNISNVSLTPCR